MMKIMSLGLHLVKKIKKCKIVLITVWNPHPKDLCRALVWAKQAREKWEINIFMELGMYICKLLQNIEMRWDCCQNIHRNIVRTNESKCESTVLSDRNDLFLNSSIRFLLFPVKMLRMPTQLDPEEEKKLARANTMMSVAMFVGLCATIRAGIKNHVGCEFPLNGGFIA